MSPSCLAMGRSVDALEFGHRNWLVGRLGRLGGSLWISSIETPRSSSDSGPRISKTVGIHERYGSFLSGGIDLSGNPCFLLILLPPANRPLECVLPAILFSGRSRPQPSDQWRRLYPPPTV